MKHSVNGKVKIRTTRSLKFFSGAFYSLKKFSARLMRFVKLLSTVCLIGNSLHRSIYAEKLGMDVINQLLMISNGWAPCFDNSRVGCCSANHTMLLLTRRLSDLASTLNSWFLWHLVRVNDPVTYAAFLLFEKQMVFSMGNLESDKRICGNWDLK